ncbi:MAG TPA: transglutaminase-like domain-containing protein [Anaerolineales bacterium]|nr:transglutaminase-like domain-containing protein [Anaerolineales bacterium]
MARLSQRTADPDAYARRFGLAKVSRMIIALTWNWLRKNAGLTLLLMATTCLAVALGEIARGATWSLFIPVTLAATLYSWWIGKSHLNGKQVFGSLIGLGIPGTFMYVAGLLVPFGNLILAAASCLPFMLLWLHDRSEKVDFTSLIITWIDLINRATAALARTWEWSIALATGKTVIDPLASGVAWSVLLWLVSVWAGWRLRQNHRALPALAPGGILLALVLDYTQKRLDLVVLYLAFALALIGLERYEEMNQQWARRHIDYSESITFDTFAAIAMVTVFLVLAAAGTPSLSWQDLVDKLRQARHSNDRVAESLGLPAPPPVSDTYKPHSTGGLPRSHLLGMPPKELESLVMTVRTGEISPIPDTSLQLNAPHYYWRMETYDVYTGSGWLSSASQNIPFTAGASLMKAPIGYHVLHQQIDLAPDQVGQLYWSGILASANVNLEVAWRIPPPPNPNPALNGDMLGAVTNSPTYTVTSYVPQVTVDQLRAAGNAYPAVILNHYLKLPDSVPDRVLALARKITESAATPYDSAKAIETYLRQFPYTLDVPQPPLGRDVVDYFLFDLQKGYCDYYASSMVVLARAAGLPARLVIGYASGEYDNATAQYIVRQKNAHSWVEIYFPNIGWIEFEPTTGLPPITRPGSKTESAPVLTPPPADTNSARVWLEWRAWISTIGGKVLLTLASFVILIIFWQIAEIWILRSREPTVAINQIYTRLQRASTRLLPDLPDGHTPLELQHALSDRLDQAKSGLMKTLLKPSFEEIEQLIVLYTTQTFSQLIPRQAQIHAGINAWIWLRWRLWIAGRTITNNPINKWFHHFAIKSTNPLRPNS